MIAVRPPIARSAPPRRARSVEILDDDDPRQDAQHAGGSRDEVGGSGHSGGQRAQGSRAAGIRHHDLHASRIGLPRPAERRKRGVQVVGENGVGESAESSGDRGLVPRGDSNVLGNQPADAGRSHDRRRTILLVHRHRQGRGAGGKRIPLALEGVQFVAHGLDGRLKTGDLRLGLLVDDVELLIAGIADRRLGLERDELDACRVAPMLGFGERGLLAHELTLRRGEAGLRDIDLARESRDLEVVARDERALGADLLVQGVERRLGRRRRTGCGSDRDLGHGDIASQPLGFGTSIRDHAVGNRRAIPGGF